MTVKTGSILVSKIGQTVRSMCEAQGIALGERIPCTLVEQYDTFTVTVLMTVVDDEGPLTLTMTTNDLIVDWDE